MQNINILNKILGSLPNNLNDLEKARYLYLESCKIFTFSTKIQNTDEISFAKMYNQKVDAASLETTEVNCRIWSQIYSQLLSYANIKNKIIDNRHQCVKLYIGDKEWIADATYGSYNDLSRVKNNDKTVGFGCNLYQGSNKCLISIRKEDLNLLDEIDKKLEYLFSKLGKLNEGYYEAKDFVMNLEGQLLDSDEFQRVKAVELKEQIKMEQ